jgi:NADH-quinone oxidoreductase subunit L
MEAVYLAIPLFPLAGAIIAGLFGRQIGRVGAHSVTIGAVAVSFVLSVIAFWHIVFGGGAVYNQSVYTWMVSDGITFEIGFLIDRLTVLMMTTVTSVSLMVHIYTIGYMHDDPGYQRFFSYISLFTFSMLMLVMANNFMQLFFGWEAVGVVSYLLIGFWYTRESAIFANLKAFLVNRVGDFGFLLGIGAILAWTGTLDYAQVFAQAGDLANARIELFDGAPWSVATVACLLLFVGAMGKSAQVPLHVWLPDSMEGPTPISALIHAATMVTAGIFMLARMSPLFEMSETALSFVLVIGAVTALAMGLVGIVQHDIKRVVAYSTLSQLGYMTVALGASAYSAAIFHLMTHAFFKALLFLGAGSVIIAMHHEQDMRRMGGLRRYMPVTYITAVIGSLALIGFPGFSGFFSKDAIIEGVHYSDTPGAGFAYWCVLIGVFVTALYTFRMLFLTFHGEPRMDEHTREHLHETPLVVTVPLVLLAIPSVIIGAWAIGPLLFGGWFGTSIQVLPEHDVMAKLGEGFHGWWGFILHGFQGPAVYLALAGVVVAWFVWLRRPELADRAAERLRPLHRILEKKYGFDELYQTVFADGGRRLGGVLSRVGDQRVIDDWIVNGAARAVGQCSGLMRHLQSGYLYHYAFAMILGVLVALSWILLSA